MSELRRILSEAGPALAQSLPVWRDPVIVVLVGIVLGCLWFYAEAMDA